MSARRRFRFTSPGCHYPCRCLACEVDTVAAHDMAASWTPQELGSGIAEAIRAGDAETRGIMLLALEIQRNGGSDGIE